MAEQDRPRSSSPWIVAAASDWGITLGLMNLPELIYLDFHQIPLLHIFLTHVWVCRPITSISIKSCSISSIRKDMCIDHLEPICDARCQDAQVLTFARHSAQIAPCPVALRCGWLAHKVVAPCCFARLCAYVFFGQVPWNKALPPDLPSWPHHSSLVSEVGPIFTKVLHLFFSRSDDPRMGEGTSRQTSE